MVDMIVYFSGEQVVVDRESLELDMIHQQEAVVQKLEVSLIT